MIHLFRQSTIAALGAALLAAGVLLAAQLAGAATPDTGAIRSQVTGQGPAKVYTAGQSFFELPGSTHLVSANASKTEPVRFLVVFIANKGTKLTTMGPAGH